MGKFINQDLLVRVNGVDLSNHAFNVDVSLKKDEIDMTGFNATGSKEFLPGTKDEEITVQFLQDFAASSVDATLWPLYAGGSAFPIYVLPVATGGSAGSTNPSYSGTANLYEYHPLNGAEGARSETSVTFKLTGGIVRATSGTA